ncbi:MAG: RdgB/HAM1 family non-canonical purine NTP pyrophosphatase [bacterium]
MKLIFATHNEGKIKEMKQILSGLDIKIISASKAGIKDEIVEDGETFIANATKKAKFVASKTGELSVADDSGICIKALNEEPGVRTARWAGKNAKGIDLVNYTLKKMKSIPEGKRQAYFESVAVLAEPNGEKKVFSGQIQGEVTISPQGKLNEKLPYDVIFQPEGFTQTFAEMSEDEKNSLSHRGLAFKQMKEYLHNINNSPKSVSRETP